MKSSNNRFTPSRHSGGFTRSLMDIVDSVIAHVPLVTVMKSDREIYPEMIIAGEDSKDSFIEWGKYGWTVNILADYSEYFIAPDSQDEADRVSLKYCSNSNMSEYFRRLLKEKPHNKSLLKESIFCYQNRKYYSCACLLFALIDGSMIRIQSFEDNRKFGERGIKYLEKIITQRPGLQYATFLYLDFLCLNRALAEIFGSYTNFRNEPQIINRNFVMHGMLSRRVRKKDCIQLYLVYGNFLRYLEFYDKIKDIPIENIQPSTIEILQQRFGKRNDR